MSTRNDGPIVVIGSINMDLVCRTPTMPRPGETILGGEFLTIPGGKGANQAVAAAKLARRNRVEMIGRVGDDAFGAKLLAGLKTFGVGTRRVRVTRNTASGVAMILVDSRGENSIVVAPGANAKLTPDDIDAAEPLIRRAAVVVMQLEIPLATVRRAIQLCRRHGVFTILDPAPVPPGGLPKELRSVDLLTPNEVEARAMKTTHGAKSVVMKMSRKGAVAMADGWRLSAPGFKVKVVDTTAAGDAFTGALAVARAESMEWQDALRFANAAGALCCTKLGAQPATPTRDAVIKLVDR